MTRRRALCGLLLLSAVLAGFAGWLWIANARKPTRAKFEQVRKGMSREEVIRIVGGPPGDYSDGEWSSMPRLSGYEAHDSWFTDEGELLVRFDDTDIATHVVIVSVGRAVLSRRPPSFTERIRRCLGL
jgi:hypothetical protein